MSGVPDLEVVNVSRAPPQGNRRHKTFLITVNPNHAVASTDDSIQQGEILRRHLQSIFDDHAVLERMLHIRGGAYDNETIESIRVEYAVELGGKRHRIHAHARVHFIHRASDLIINIPALRKYLNDLYYPDTDKGIHLNVRSIKTDDALRDYLRKMGSRLV